MSTETTHQGRAIEADLDRPAAPDLPEDVVEVRRDGPLSAVVAGLAGVVAVLFLVRAVGGGTALDWFCALLVGAVAVAHAAILLDSRAPLMVLDSHGVRTRRGRVWEGIAWGHVARVEHTPRASLLRDGRLEFTDTEGRSLAVRLSLSTRLAGANWHELTDALVDLADGHTHVVERAEDDRIEAVEDQAGYAAAASETASGPESGSEAGSGSDDVFDQESDLSGDWLADTTDPAWARADDEGGAETSVEGVRTDGGRTAASVTDTDETSTFVWTAPPSSDPAAPTPVEVRGAPAPSLDTTTTREDIGDAHDTEADDTDARHTEAETEEHDTDEPGPARDLGRTPAPLRDLVTARRSEVVLDRPETPAVAVTPGDGTPVETHESPAYPTDDSGPRDRSQTTTIVFDDALTGRVDPVADPVIGNELAAARTRLGLGVDQLATRTRIRPHVIEAIEVDDFGPCGGDFYARGHLRTLGRVLGVDPEPLVATYEERYSDAPIDPRRVFSSELAGAPGGSLRGGTRGGFNWSLLVACVMAVVLVWSVARLLTGGSTPLADQPVLDGTPGRASLSGSSTTVPVTLTAAGGGASLIVRDGSRNAKIVFKDDLAFGQTAELDVVPPVRISSTDGSVEVSVDGQDEGALGETGQRAEQVFVPDE